MSEFSDTETFDIETILTLPESITYLAVHGFYYQMWR